MSKAKYILPVAVDITIGYLLLRTAIYGGARLKRRIKSH